MVGHSVWVAFWAPGRLLQRWWVTRCGWLFGPRAACCNDGGSLGVGGFLGPGPPVATMVGHSVWVAFWAPGRLLQRWWVTRCGSLFGPRAACCNDGGSLGVGRFLGPGPPV